MNVLEFYRLQKEEDGQIDGWHLLHNKIEHDVATICTPFSQLKPEFFVYFADVMNAEIVEIFNGYYGLSATVKGVKASRVEYFMQFLCGNVSSDLYDQLIADDIDTPDDDEDDENDDEEGDAGDGASEADPYLIHCPLCVDGVMVRNEAGGFWSCEECPGILFEYIDEADTKKMADVLQ